MQPINLSMKSHFILCSTVPLLAIISLLYGTERLESFNKNLASIFSSSFKKEVMTFLKTAILLSHLTCT